MAARPLHEPVEMRHWILGAGLVSTLLACGSSGDETASSAIVTAPERAAASEPAPAAAAPATLPDDAGTTENAVPHDPIDPSKAAMCDRPPVGSFSFSGDTERSYFSSLASAYDVQASIPAGAGTTGGLALVFSFPTTAYDSPTNGETWGNGIVTMGFESDALGVGTHDSIALDGGDSSAYCAANGSGGGVGGAWSNVAHARVTITTRSATLVEGTLDFTMGGGHLEFHAPVVVPKTGSGTRCCPKVVGQPD